jgi:hypothetical protein
MSGRGRSWFFTNESRPLASEQGKQVFHHF